MGAPRDGAFVHQPDPALKGANPALATLSADLVMANAATNATVVHSHTWYTGLAGHLAALLYGIPHVLTAHSLEPMRPWKAEQLGGGYRISSWVERTAVEAADAVVAVSSGMRNDVLHTYPALDPNRVHVVRNGIDTDVWYPVTAGAAGSDESVLTELGVDPTRPIVAFVGRITRQKGVAHLVAAAHRFSPEVQLVLCAGAPDTPEIAAEVTTAVQELSRARTGVFWVREMLAIGKIREILSAATVFVCPSVYEPLGIVNLEAMACATAVVASDVGGIPEVVADHLTGLLVHYDAGDPEFFESRLADAVNSLVADPGRARQYGEAGRQRCIDEFSWAHIAEQTLEIYRKVSS
jgi:starch synthase